MDISSRYKERDISSLGYLIRYGTLEGTFYPKTETFPEFRLRIRSIPPRYPLKSLSNKHLLVSLVHKTQLHSFLFCLLFFTYFFLIFLSFFLNFVFKLLYSILNPPRISHTLINSIIA